MILSGDSFLFEFLLRVLFNKVIYTFPELRVEYLRGGVNDSSQAS